MTLQWRHNEHEGVSKHQSSDCLLNCLFRRRSEKTSKFRVTGLCERNSPVTGEFPAQSASNAKEVSIVVAVIYTQVMVLDGYCRMTLPFIGHHLSWKLNAEYPRNQTLLTKIAKGTIGLKHESICSTTYFFMMTSSNANILRVTGPLCREFTGHRWIPLAKASDAELWCFLRSAHEQKIDQTIETMVIWGTIALIMTSLWWMAFNDHWRHKHRWISCEQNHWITLNSSLPGQNGCHFADDIFR